MEIAIVKRTGVYNDSVQLQAQNAGAAAQSPKLIALIVIPRLHARTR